MGTVTPARLCAGLSTLAVAAGLLVAVVPPAAAAADGLVYHEDRYPVGNDLPITARGHGPGRGLSQYGARAMAAQGSTSAQILDFYYPGTTAGTSPDADQVRVRLTGVPTGAVTVAWAAGLQVRDLSTGAVTALDGSFGHYRVVRAGSAMEVLGSADRSTWDPVVLGGGAVSVPGPLVFEGPALLRLDATLAGGFSATYHGSILAGYGPGEELSTVNIVGMRQYMYDALSEMFNGGWPVQAQYAQAVALRSLVESVRGAAGRDWDLTNSGPWSIRYFPNESCYPLLRPPPTDPAPCLEYPGVQLYANDILYRTYETAVARAAADDTADQVRSFAGAPISGQFTASNGGWTVADPAYPYLVAQPDPYSAAEPTWTYSSTPVNVAIRCFPGLGFNQVDAVAVLGRDGRGEWGGRITGLRLEGATATGSRLFAVLTGDRLLDCLRLDGVDSTYLLPVAATLSPLAVSAVISARGTAFLGNGYPTGIQMHTYRPGYWLGFELGGASHYNPGMVLLPSGWVRVFVTGTNGALYSQDVRPDDTAASGIWRKWGGSIVGQPAAVLMPDHSVGVYVHAANGHLYEGVFSSTGVFRGWTNLGGPVLVPGSGPAAASTGSGRAVVAVNGGDTGVWVRGYQPGSGWSAWSSIGGAAFSGIAGVSPSPGVFEVYATAAAASPVDRDVRTARLAAGRWTSWQSLGGQVYDNPAAAVSGGTTLLWAVGLNFAEYQRTRTATGWGPWRRLGT
jgi:hypothetical protein